MNVELETDGNALDFEFPEITDEDAEMLNFQLIDVMPTDPVGTTPPVGVPQSGRFKQISQSDVDFFLINQQNANTKKKTRQDVSVLQMYMAEIGENRLPEIIPPNELNKILSGFLLALKKKDGSEYEPNSLRSFISSFDRHLKMKAYPVSIISDLQFTKTQEVFKLKQKQLKSLGKGNTPRAADSITDEELEHLYKCKVLGGDNPSSLLHSLWAICTTHFGMRPGKETHSLMWGDVLLKTDENNQCEYLVC